MDRSGLAVTTILAAVVLQAEAKTSLIMTWQDLFFSISIAFEFIAFFVTVMSGHYVSVSLGMRRAPAALANGTHAL